jgi:hypothetical protein
VCARARVRVKEMGFISGCDDDGGAFKSVDIMKRLNEQIESCFILHPDGYYCYLGKSEQSVRLSLRRIYTADKEALNTLIFFLWPVP